jgi:hypothetical protein
MLPDLVHLEQRVNERLGTDPPPAIPGELLPEAGQWLPMTWARVPRDRLRMLADDAVELAGLDAALDAGDGLRLFPLHPFLKSRYAAESLIESGRFTVSASYRTVFFEPEAGTPLQALVPAGERLMIKLHLDDPLPGIAGDRRLTPQKTEKCIQLSALIPRQLPTVSEVCFTVLRERFGLLHDERGAIFRRVPATGVLPVFSIYSRDASLPDNPPWLLARLQERFSTARSAAEGLGELLAAPLIAPILAGFRAGLSLEMHAQNTLIRPGQGNRLISEVMFRDLESVVVLRGLREAFGLPPADLDVANPEYFIAPEIATRWFNRNVDHDLGRSLRWSLRVLEREGYFSSREVDAARCSIRRALRCAIRAHGLERLARPGRWLPYSRSPYGDGLRTGHYYRTDLR